MAAKVNYQTLVAAAMVKYEGKSIADAAKEHHVHRTSIWRALQRNEAEILEAYQKLKGNTS